MTKIIKRIKTKTKRVSNKVNPGIFSKLSDYRYLCPRRIKMGKTNRVELITGSILPLSLAEKKTDSGSLEGQIADVFKSQVHELEKGISAVNDDNHKRVEASASGTGMDESMLPKYLRDSKDIKEDWQQVSRSAKASSASYRDGRAILPSSISEAETNYGGPNRTSRFANSIFDPSAIEKIENDEYTDVVINDAREKRIKAERKMQKSRDWEVVSASKSTKDVNPAQMGFTPTRSAFQPAPLEEVRLAEVEAIKKKNAASAEAGKKVAQIKSELDKVLAEKWERDFNDDRSWEDKAHEKIIEAQNREMNIVFNEPELAKDFVKASPIETDFDLSGLFTVPEDPSQYREASIKREDDHLKDPRRSKRREDDRSWETVRNARSRKWQG